MKNPPKTVNKWQLKFSTNLGLALSGFEQLGLDLCKRHNKVKLTAKHRQPTESSNFEYRKRVTDYTP